MELRLKEHDLKVVVGPEKIGEEGGNVTLECPVVGYPKPQITWLKDNKELRESLRLLMNVQWRQKEYFWTEQNPNCTSLFLKPQTGDSTAAM